MYSLICGYGCHGLVLFCLGLNAIFNKCKIYCGSTFYWWWKPVYPRGKHRLQHYTNKLYYIKLYPVHISTNYNRIHIYFNYISVDKL